MITSVAILFYIKRAKVNSQGYCPIYVRVTVNSRRFEFSANKSVQIENWSTEGSNLKSKSKESRTINEHLDYLKNSVLNAEKELYIKGIEITSDNLRTVLFGDS